MDEAPPDRSAVPVPEAFFDDQLPRIQDLAELKAVLYVLRLADRRRGAVPLSDLLATPVLRSVVGASSPRPAETRMQEALRRAVANGTLLQVTVRAEEGPTPYYLPATPENRRLLERMRWGEEPPEELRLPFANEFVIHRPNIFALYEQHMGPLTPLLAEQLRDAERSYPREWIEEAMREAIRNNKRAWRYVESILSSWEALGGPGRGSRRAPPP